MKPRLAVFILCACLLLPNGGSAQNVVLDVTEQTLNRLVGRLGALSHAGVRQLSGFHEVFPGIKDCIVLGFLECPQGPWQDLGFGEPRIPLVACETRGRIVIPVTGPTVSWQWWVTGARFTLRSNSMTFTATVHSRIGGETQPPVTRTVGASVSFDSNSNRLRINLNPFTVRLQKQFAGEIRTLATAQVAKLYTLSIPIGPENISVPQPTGGSKNLTAKIHGFPNVAYLHERIRVTIDVKVED